MCVILNPSHPCQNFEWQWHRNTAGNGKNALRRFPVFLPGRFCFTSCFGTALCASFCSTSSSSSSSKRQLLIWAFPSPFLIMARLGHRLAVCIFPASPPIGRVSTFSFESERRAHSPTSGGARKALPPKSCDTMSSVTETERHHGRRKHFLRGGEGVRRTVRRI